MLRDEINNIALRIVKAREAKNQMLGNYEPAGNSADENNENMFSGPGNWRVPAIEHFDRGYNEQIRYYNCFPY